MIKFYFKVEFSESYGRTFDTIKVSVEADTYIEATEKSRKALHLMGIMM